MFALAIWDVRRRTLVLARDRLGQKPLVYRHDGARLRLRQRAQRPAGPARGARPAAGRSHGAGPLPHYGYMPHPRTIRKGVPSCPRRTTPSGTRASDDRAVLAARLERRARNGPIEEDIEELRATLDDAVREQMIADVPLGAFLSGGIDSTIIAGLMQQASSRPVKTFAIGFPRPGVRRDAITPSSPRATWGPSIRRSSSSPRRGRRCRSWPGSSTSRSPTARPCRRGTSARETRRSVTVALTGDAGDELFGGYDRYRALGLTELFQRLPDGPRRVLGGTMVRVMPRSARSKTRLRKLQRLFETHQRAGRGSLPRLDDRPSTRPRRLSTLFRRPARPAGRGRCGAATTRLRPTRPRSLASAFALRPRRDPITRAMVADLLTYLPGDLLVKVDLASMAHSLECRGPFLDHRVVELAAAMPIEPQDPRSARAAPRSCSSRHSPTYCRPRSRLGPRWVSASRSADGSATS